MLPTTSGSRGDWLVESNQSKLRNWVNPAPRMLMATPETMWSTPKPTVAMAWSRPPTAPPSMPMMTPCHGPNSMQPQAPKKVPRIIIPSRPMLTMPARSDQRPPSPARAMGSVSLRADSHVFDAVSRFWSVICSAAVRMRTKMVP